MYHARAKHCTLCNKQYTQKEHQLKTWVLEPGTSKKASKAREAFIDIRKTQQNMDEFGKWKVPEHLEFNIKQPQIKMLPPQDLNEQSYYPPGKCCFICLSVSDDIRKTSCCSQLIHEQCYYRGITSALDLTRPKYVVLSLQNKSK